GFSFRNYNSDELYNIIEYALWIYKDKGKWENLIENAMNSDNSWNRSAQIYLDLYRELTGQD
ncbi:glycogen synthase, partial [Clostridium beijerinckii]|nr:glycogen synthase [Clostridium beijerinckii]